MNKPLSYALFGAGGSAAILAMAAIIPRASVVSPIFGDTVTGKAAWLLVAGAVAAAAARVLPARLQPSTTT